MWWKKPSERGGKPAALMSGARVAAYCGAGEEKAFVGKSRPAYAAASRACCIGVGCRAETAVDDKKLEALTKAAEPIPTADKSSPEPEEKNWPRRMRNPHRSRQPKSMRLNGRCNASSPSPG
jgi:hypothetical protein